ncbi:MAG: phosphotransferase, partial [Acidobacteria bacterium]|nr:phosphotransferase [Acidobacteriota bacterium]
DPHQGPVGRREQRQRLEVVRRRLLVDEPHEHADELALIHGDPALGNYMISGTQVTAVIDWELAGILTPAYDIAMQCLANFYYRSLSSPEVVARIPSDVEWVALYERISGRRIVNLDYYRRVAACVLLVVQISMARNFTGAALKAYLQGLEPIWQVAESV